MMEVGMSPFNIGMFFGNVGIVFFYVSLLLLSARFSLHRTFRPTVYGVGISVAASVTWLMNANVIFSLLLTAMSLLIAIGLLIVKKGRDAVIDVGKNSVLMWLPEFSMVMIILCFMVSIYFFHLSAVKGSHAHKGVTSCIVTFPHFR